MPVLVFLRGSRSGEQDNDSCSQIFIVGLPFDHTARTMTPETATSQPAANRYAWMEVAGAFGELGTLVPFIDAYLAVLKMDPFGVLLAFGIAMVVCGLLYRTPMPCNR